MTKLKLPITDSRMLKLIELLKDTGKIETRQEFLDAIDVPKQNIYNIKIMKQSFTTKQIGAACDLYNINVNWIFGLEKEIYRVNKNVNKKPAKGLVSK
jgi:hypothetical protein